MTDTQENVNMTVTETQEDNQNGENTDINEIQVRALNVLIELVMMAHKRSAYSLEEAAKAWSAIKVFIPDKPATDEPATDEPATDEPARDGPATDEPATDGLSV